MRAGHLFAGIDGIGLGLTVAGPFVPAWFSENEDAPSRVLAHHYPDIPNHGDVTTIDYSKVEPVDVLTGGFPCQDISKAGRGAGIKEGTRSGLWFEYVRAIRDLRPGLVLIENVSALAIRGGDIVLSDLAALGFDAWWTTLRASDVGAAHRRERMFIVAASTDRDRLGHLHRQALLQPAEARFHALRDAPTGRHEDAPDPDGAPRGQQGSAGEAVHEPGAVQRPGRRGEVDGREVAGDTHDAGLEGRQTQPERGGELPAGKAGVVDWGEFGPAIRRWERIIGRPAPAPSDDGRLSPEFVEWHMGFPAGWTDMLTRNERLKCLGNAVVPQCAAVVGKWALDLVDKQATDDAADVA